jgi:hypothetical protein
MESGIIGSSREGKVVEVIFAKNLTIHAVIGDLRG